VARGQFRVRARVADANTRSRPPAGVGERRGMAGVSSDLESLWLAGMRGTAAARKSGHGTS